MLTFNEPLSSSAFHDSLHLPGVLYAEPFRSVPIRLKHGARQYRLGLMGLLKAPHCTEFSLSIAANKLARTTGTHDH